MKKTTFEKYENFLQACRTKSVIPNIRQMAKEHNVSVTFTDWLIKNRYLVKMTGGSYKFMSKPLELDRIVSAYSAEYAAMRVKEPKIDLTEFAYPISVRCEKDDDREKCIKLLEQIGYKNSGSVTGINVVSNYLLEANVIGRASDGSLNRGTRYHIDHFNADLIRDIASVRTGDVWVKGEPFIHLEYNDYTESNLGIAMAAGEKINGDLSAHLRRPTIAEICDHYGYELDGMNIVKKTEAKQYATGGVITSKEEVFVASKVAHELSKAADRLKTKIDQAANTIELNRREAEAIKLLKSIESDHGVSYSLTRTETTKTVLL